MEKANFKAKQPFITVCIFIIIAALCRNIGREIPGRFLSLLRSLIYVGLFSYWFISVRRRVMQAAARRLLSSIAALMLFWITERTVKYFFVSDPNVIRYLWYFYYLPMLLIPFLSVPTALSLGKPENYRLPRWAALFFIPILALTALVITNDMHQFVFTFPKTAEIWTDNDYSYNTGYFIILGVMLICAISAIGIMIAKCRGSRGKRAVWLPLLFIFAAVCYAVLYILYITDHNSLFYYVCGDMTVSLCLLFAGTLESCLQSGLIPTNTGYAPLFKAMTFGIQIADGNNNIRYSSNAARQLTGSEIESAKHGGFSHGTSLIKAYPIDGGCAVWQEDISELLHVKKQLEDVKEELRERNEILRDQYRRDAERYKTEEQNRLYDLVQRETQGQLSEIDSLTLKFCEDGKSEREKRAALFKILVLATYIKRRKDMVIAADRSKFLPLATLNAALGESCGNLPLGGIEYNIYAPQSNTEISVGAALGAYACFESVLESTLSTLLYILVSVCERENGLYMTLNAECKADISAFADKLTGAGTEKTEDGFIIYYPLSGGEGE